ncbi:type II toxin-antitoxin system VapC family toxin [Nocardia brasiliensis]|uniref:type II toxin-antitoxin system VapC family toxin n=1 Tax=Nocardia brasiliensis TaxID=37326 RepID=UPI001896076E|nr:type II toxin-antitoxin system VapC family toxin [Nocardia brasiliensis]MBF6545340.1 type II toxin-antitoxin system VapC family toxin [Nocardia brasiliensis]
MLILDTNVIAAAMVPEKNPVVAAWLATVADFYTTSITVMEVAKGIYPMAEGRKRDALLAASDAVFAPLLLADRILNFDYSAAFCYALLMLKRPKPSAGEITDAQIAAIALAHEAVLVTQNVKDFAGRGVRVFDPSTGTEH